MSRLHATNGKVSQIYNGEQAISSHKTPWHSSRQATKLPPPKKKIEEKLQNGKNVKCTWTGRRVFFWGSSPEHNRLRQRQPSVIDLVREAGSRQQLDRRRRRGDVPTPSTVNDVQRQASRRRNSSGPYGRRKRQRRDTVTRSDNS